MRKAHVIALVVAAAIMMTMGLSCSRDKYKDAISVHAAFADAMVAYFNQMEKANNAQAVADALDTFAAKVEKIAPRMKEMSEKYPELKDPKNQPKALKAIRKRTADVGKKMGDLMMKIMQYRDDPKVKAAQMRVQKAMGLMM
jgi:hypothetical protein